MKYILSEIQLKKLISESGESEEGQEVFPNVKVAYHVTPDIFLNQIREVGLVPKSESKLESHPERVYLYMLPDKDKELANALWDATKKEIKDKIKDYYVLKIDLEKIPNHKFYGDPESFFGFIGMYTLEPIPSSAIKVVKKLPTSEFTPGPTPEQIRKEREDSQIWLAQYQNKKPESSESPWEELLKKMEKFNPKDLTVSVDDLKKMDENIFRVKEIMGILTEQEKRFNKSSQSITNAIEKYMNYYISEGERKITPKSRNYGNFREDWCIDGKETIHVFYYFEKGKFDKGSILISKNIVESLSKTLNVRQSYVLNTIAEWYEETMVPVFEKIVGESGLGIDDIDTSEKDHECIPQSVKEEGITDEEMIDFVVKNTLYNREDVLEKINSGEEILDDLYLQIKDIVKQKKILGF